jgi:NADPH:quinone reductase-like Zn-dependent oxidoreductase
MDMLADGTVRPPPPRKVYPLAEARAAVHDACLEVPGGTGKVMLGN